MAGQVSPLGSEILKGVVMKIGTLVAAALAAATLMGAAGAGELADACIERLQADGRDTSGCTCLENAVKDDPALVEEMTALAEVDDPAERYAAASADAKAAMDSCTR
jgi:hypothetical protein